MTRNLCHIEQLIILRANLESLSKRQYKLLLVVEEIYRQQKKVSLFQQALIKDQYPGS